MSVPARYAARRWWRRRFHLITRVGWNVATMGRERPASQSIIGIGLMAVGLIAQRKRRRRLLYKGTIEPGSGTHIRVYRGSRPVYNGPIGG